MATGLFIWKARNSFLFLFLFLFFGCVIHGDKDDSSKQMFHDNIDNASLVCRLGNGYFSNYFRKYASKEQKYSHIGIISKEKEKLYVYHSEASELTGVGHVKKEPLHVFLNNIDLFDFYKLNLSENKKTRIIDIVDDYYQVKTPFDLRFDSYNDNALYCSELIATAINIANDSIIIRPSLELNGKNLFALDDIYLHDSVEKIRFYCFE